MTFLSKVRNGNNHLYLMYFLLGHWGPRMLEDRYVSSPPNVFHRFLWLIPLLPGSIFRQTILYFWSEVVYYSTHTPSSFFLNNRLKCYNLPNYAEFTGALKYEKILAGSCEVVELMFFWLWNNSGQILS